LIEWKNSHRIYINTYYTNACTEWKSDQTLIHLQILFCRNYKRKQCITKYVIVLIEMCRHVLYKYNRITIINKYIMYKYIVSVWGSLQIFVVGLYQQTCWCKFRWIQLLYLRKSFQFNNSKYNNSEKSQNN